MTTLLITGAAGSIGRAFIEYNILNRNAIGSFYKIIAVDNNDYELWKLKKQYENELLMTLEIILADIRDTSNKALQRAVKEADVILHCAAYKNIELTEDAVFETVNNDYIATEKLLSLFNKKKAKKKQNYSYQFILISSDKAVEPISVLGASKLLAEKAVHESARLFAHSKKTYKILRFANVIETRGNVFELWRQQKEKKEKFTITHEKTSRYFASIKKITQFISDAIGDTTTNSTFIYNYGEQQYIVDVLKEQYGQDAEYEIIGLRKNEKLQDVLLTSEEDKRVYTSGINSRGYFHFTFN